LAGEEFAQNEAICQPQNTRSAVFSGLDYQKLVFDYTRHPDQDAAQTVRRPVVLVGAGPVGLALAIDCWRLFKTDPPTRAAIAQI